ncbi:hypothetical protein GOV14_04135 [Candidatus Pacearchaeota archaeon]|nr:hypothetical protein [Candidatus Pacearchaeota archaeon]
MPKKSVKKTSRKRVARKTSKAKRLDKDSKKYIDARDKTFFKVFAVYEIIVSVITLILGYLIYIFGKKFIAETTGANSFYGVIFIIGFIITILGILGGIFLLKKQKHGFLFSMIWSVAQILGIRINLYWVDFSQLVWLGFKYNSPLFGFGINAVGIVLVLLLIHFRKKKIV